VPHTIAVGVDGSAPSLVALRWALACAHTHRADLLAVIATPPPLERSRDSTRASESRNREITDHVAEVKRAIAVTAEGVPVQVETLEGSPTEVLLAVSNRVDLLVVGGHGYRGWRRHFSTSIPGRLAIHTKAVVCVVRAIQEPGRRRVVVGHKVETSPQAARFAVAEAALSGSSALVVITWQYPRDTRATSPEAADILEEGASAALAEVLDTLRSEFPGVTIDGLVRIGHPVEVLAELADSADMVVIGSREHRGLLGSDLATLVVGSVAIGLLRRVQTPVIIVPTEG